LGEGGLKSRAKRRGAVEVAAAEQGRKGPKRPIVSNQGQGRFSGDKFSRESTIYQEIE